MKSVSQSGKEEEGDSTAGGPHLNGGDLKRTDRLRRINSRDVAISEKFIVC